MNTRPMAWLTCAVAGFTGFVAWHQNVAGAVGGPISTPKCFWLALTIVTFVVVPLTLGFARNVPGALRRMFLAVATSFLLRGAIEIPLLRHTRLWRCEYGIAHDLAALAFVVFIAHRSRKEASESGRRAREFAIFLAVMLAIEAIMAWLFHRVASPADGVYYAADTDVFKTINRFTALTDIVAWPWLLLWWRRAGKAGA